MRPSGAKANVVGLFRPPTIVLKPNPGGGPALAGPAPRAKTASAAARTAAERAFTLAILTTQPDDARDWWSCARALQTDARAEARASCFAGAAGARECGVYAGGQAVAWNTP